MGVKVQESAVELIKSSSKEKIAMLSPLSGSRSIGNSGVSPMAAQESHQTEEDADIHKLNQKVS